MEGGNIPPPTGLSLLEVASASARQLHPRWRWHLWVPPEIQEAPVAHACVCNNLPGDCSLGKYQHRGRKDLKQETKKQSKEDKAVSFKVQLA